ncbi:MAG: sigma-70 family RNA polymerase sigma factor [Planctomycetes bacterium]|nr:sigma-70 family RNA polymerase sigma factor [Planctomycetota bacterium]
MSGEPPSLEIFVRELTCHQTRLRGLVRCLLFDRKQAEDVLQDTNVVLLRKAAEYQPGTDFWAWASQVARYQVLTHAKRLGRERLVFDEELMESLAAESQLRAASLDQRRDALLACLERLPAPQRQLLEMRYSLGQSMDQIASTMSRPSGSVRQTLYRVREALLSCIERRMVGEASS